MDEACACQDAHCARADRVCSTETLPEFHLPDLKKYLCMSGSISGHNDAPRRLHRPARLAQHRADSSLPVPARLCRVLRVSACSNCGHVAVELLLVWKSSAEPGWTVWAVPRCRATTGAGQGVLHSIFCRPIPSVATTPRSICRVHRQASFFGLVLHIHT
ncbi:hypothetical protein PSPO01_10532 [Paraphaeosphaeria sporulosa]